MKDWQFGIDKRRIGEAFPDLLDRENLDLPLGGLGYFFKVSEGFVILVEVEAGVGGDEGVT